MPARGGHRRKYRHRICAFATAAVWCVSVTVAKTPQQLISEFANILPAGMKARLAWEHSKSIYVLDSDSGVIRDLTPPSIFPGGTRTASNPSVTHDGSRVVFFDAASSSVCVINWNGSGFRSFPLEGYMSRYWRDWTTNSDWVTYDRYGIYRVNIDNQSQRVLLWNKTSVSWPWFTLSQDGTHLALLCPHPNIGIAAVPNGSLKIADSTGCKPNIAPDNSYHVMFQTPYHRIIRICDSNGVKIKDFNPNDAIIAWATANGKLTSGLREHNWLRWTNNRDYITFQMNCTSVNPFIMRISDGAWMYIEDNATDNVVGSLDMVIYARSGQPDVAPVIVAVSDFCCQLNRQSQFTVWVTGTPQPTLSASGLPPSMAVINGSIPALSFVLAGTPSQIGTYRVILTATNRAGTATDTVLITVKSTNDPPVVDAGPDGGVRVGTSYTLFGVASDDGIPNPALQIVWRQVAGPTGSAFIANTATRSTQVGFTAEGIYKFELSAFDGEFSVADTVMIVVEKAIPFMVTRPTAGEKLRIGSSYVVSWQIDPAASVDLELSTDGGASFSNLVGRTLSAGVTSWAWNIPPTQHEAEECLIRVVVYDNKTKIAVSGKFSLVKTTAELRGWEKVVVDVGEETHDSWEFYGVQGRRIFCVKPPLQERSRTAGCVVLKCQDSRSRVVKKTINPKIVDRHQ